MNIKSVARLSGLSTHVLRAWERRYQVIQPSRSPGGQRLYAMADVEKLKLLAALVDRGHSIGTIARLTQSELEALSRESLTPLMTDADGGGPDVHHHSLEPLLAAVRRLDFDELDRQILKARLNTPAKAFVLEIAGPLLSEVGRLSVEGSIDVAQEHAFSAILRNHLGEILSQVQKTTPWPEGKKAKFSSFLFATPEGDLHEFGILLAAILTGSRGICFRYLGANMPAEGLAKAAISIGVTVVVIGSVKASAKRLEHPLKDYVELLATQFKKCSYQNVSIWLGGHCDFEWKSKKDSIQFKHLDSLYEFDRQLERIPVQELSQQVS